LNAWRDVSPTLATGRLLIQVAVSFGLISSYPAGAALRSGILKPSVFFVSMKSL
jgi:hypothetical protein